MHQSARSLIVLVTLTLFGALPLASSPSAPPATVAGRIVDKAARPLPGVQVIALCGNPATPSGRATTTREGLYRIEALPAGACEVAASIAGFRTATQRLTLASGRTHAVNFVLEAAANADEAKVAAEAPYPGMPTGRAMPTGVAAPGMGVASIGGMAGHPYPRRPPRPYIPSRTTSFDLVEESAFLTVTANPLSTFSVDVDTASYAYVRRALTGGVLPPKDAVRIEELLNYFRYDYPNPQGKAPVGVTTDVGICPWNSAHLLLHVGLQARRPAEGRTPPRNLVFLLDVSGSMQPPDKLPLVRTAMALLTRQLTSRDRVAIVTYAGHSGLALQPTRGDRHEEILAAIDNLQAGGSTNGAAGIELAYELAARHLDREGVNRVILATDGDFNVGVTDRRGLLDLIEAKRKSGIFLSVLGVGDDNLQDGTMEQLADRGNGNYAYLDSLEEAQKVLVREAGATFDTVAKDVKIQVEFNPAHVAAYRLIGYENRALQAEDFKDDRKDAGEMGAGHSVTALYELVPPGAASADQREVDPLRYQRERSTTTPESVRGELGTVKVRYKLPDSDTSVPMDVMVVNSRERRPSAVNGNLGFSAAIAAFGMLLRDSPHKGQATWRMAADLAARHRGTDPDGYRAQFGRLIDLAEALQRTDATKR